MIKEKKVTDLSALVSAGGWSQQTAALGTVNGNLAGYYSGWVYTNIDKRATAVSKIEIKLYKPRITQKGIELLDVDSHPVLDLLDKFNDFTTRSDGIYLTQSAEDVFGDAFWYTNGEIIYIIPSDKVKVKFATDTGTGQTLITGYVYEDTVNGDKITINYEPGEIVPFKAPNLNNPIRGKSLIEAGMRTIESDSLAEEWNRRFFYNNATPDNVFSTDQKLNPDQIARIESELKRRFQGAKNAHKTMIMSGGLHLEEMSRSQKDMDFMEQQQWTRDKIMALFGNTKTALGITEDVNRANAEASMYMWLKETVKPLQARFVNTLNEFLLPIVAPAEPLIFGFEDPYPEDKAEDLDMAVKGYNKWLTRNEVREMFGLDPVSDGDEFIQPPTPDPTQDPNQDPKVPKAIRNVDYQKRFRALGLYEQVAKQKDLRIKADKIAESSVAAAREIVRNKKVIKTVPAVRESEFFTNDQVWDYHAKKIRKVEVIESRFEKAAVQFLNDMELMTISKLATIQEKGLTKVATEPIFDTEVVVKSGIDLFTPLFDEALIVGGMEALDLLGQKQNYKPSVAARESVTSNVQKFTQSMVDTDREKLIDIIVSGLEQGTGVDAITSEVRSAFDGFRKNQVRTVVRTEVLRAANEASVDVYKQSDVVVGKQWLTAEDDRVCAFCGPLNGKVVGKSKLFFKKDEVYDVGDEAMTLDYDSVTAPPLHPSCRCDILPVLLDSKTASIEEIKDLKKQLKESQTKAVELEQEKTDIEKSQVKKTHISNKKLDKLKEELEEAKSYANKLEELLDEQD